MAQRPVIHGPEYPHEGCDRWRSRRRREYSNKLFLVEEAPSSLRSVDQPPDKPDKETFSKHAHVYANESSSFEFYHPASAHIFLERDIFQLRSFTKKLTHRPGTRSLALQSHGTRNRTIVDVMCHEKDEQNINPGN